MITTNSILFIDNGPVYYLGLKDILAENEIKLFYTNASKVRASSISLHHNVNCILYHIFINSEIEQIKKNLKKLKRVFPKVKTVACIHEFSEKVLDLCFGFDGYFLAEDLPQDIVPIIKEVLETGVGISKNIAIRYLNMLQNKHLKKSMRKKNYTK